MWIALSATTTAVAATTPPWLLGVAGSIITALVGVIGFGIRAILKGDLLPRKVIEDEAARADKWEASFDRSQTNLDTIGGRMDAIEEGLRTIEKALSSITGRPRERR